jgi:hypothetical protein
LYEFDPGQIAGRELSFYLFKSALKEIIVQDVGFATFSSDDPVSGADIGEPYIGSDGFRPCTLPGIYGDRPDNTK